MRGGFFSPDESRDEPETFLALTKHEVMTATVIRHAQALPCQLDPPTMNRACGTVCHRRANQCWTLIPKFPTRGSPSCQGYGFRAQHTPAPPVAQGGAEFALAFSRFAGDPRSALQCAFRGGTNAKAQRGDAIRTCGFVGVDEQHPPRVYRSSDSTFSVAQSRSPFLKIYPAQLLNYFARQSAR